MEEIKQKPNIDPRHHSDNGSDFETIKVLQEEEVCL